MKVNTKLTLHPCGLKSWLSPLGGTGPGRRLRFSPHCQWSALLTLVKFQGTREACCCGKPQFFLFCLHLGPSQPPRFIPEHLLIAPQSSVLASSYILVTTFWSPLWALCSCCLWLGNLSNFTSALLSSRNSTSLGCRDTYCGHISSFCRSHLCGTGCPKRWAWVGILALLCLLRGGNSMASKSSRPDSALMVSS